MARKVTTSNDALKSSVMANITSSPNIFFDIPNFNRHFFDSWHIIENFVFLSQTVPPMESIPKYFSVANTALLFVLKGSVNGTINLYNVEAKAPCVVVLLSDSVIHIESISADFDYRIISYTSLMEDELNMDKFSYRSFQTVKMKPYCQMTEHEMAISVLHYNLLCELLLEDRDTPYVRESLANIVRSLFCYLIGCYPESFERPLPISRSAQLTADFLDLVQIDCKKAYDVIWYAKHFCVSTKYLSNAVLANTGKTIGSVIDEYILLRAKTLLLTSKKSILQISDQLGFANQSHFGSWFRRQTDGVSPKEFRKNN